MDIDRSIDNIARQSLLYDFYGNLLTERQGQIIELYTQENYSLGEISEQLDISRQAVHDALRNGRRSLEKYEDKLGLIRRFLTTEEAIEEIDRRILDLIEETEKSTGSSKADIDDDTRQKIVDELVEIKSIIDRIED